MTDLHSIPLSVLDLAMVSDGFSANDALRTSIDMARHVEALGYGRVWFAEHHNHPGIASSAPAVIIAAVASATERIRVGSGGVMLPNHPPLVVAEQFGTLESLYPGRIDLGIGRAPGTDPVTARALRRETQPLSADDFPEQLQDLRRFFAGAFPSGHPYGTIAAVPTYGPGPEVWVLGSSGYGAQVAGLLGLPFAFAHHISAQNAIPALELYRRSFQPSEVLSEPYAMLAVRILVAENDERAQFLNGSSELSYLQLMQGRPGRLPAPEAAAAYRWTEAEREALAARGLGQIIGGPATVRAGLAALLEATAADEVMATTVAHDPHERRESFTRLREIVDA
jgi:luciferase family oxidoreductase group 1